MVHFEIPSSLGVPGSDPQKVAKVTRSLDPMGGPMRSDLAVETRSFPSTITLCARGTPGDASEALPEAILSAPSIQIALRMQPVVLVVEYIAEKVSAPVIEDPAVIVAESPSIETAPAVSAPIVEIAPVESKSSRKKSASGPNVTVEEN